MRSSKRAIESLCCDEYPLWCTAGGSFNLITAQAIATLQNCTLFSIAFIQLSMISRSGSFGGPITRFFNSVVMHVMLCSSNQMSAGDLDQW